MMRSHLSFPSLPLQETLHEQAMFAYNQKGYASRMRGYHLLGMIACLALPLGVQWNSALAQGAPPAATSQPAVTASAPAVSSQPPTATSAQAQGWKRVEGLGPHSRILIKSDKATTVCYVHFVEEQQLTCSKSESIGSDSLVFARSEIKTIKIARGGMLGGLVLGMTNGIVSKPDELMAGTVVYQR